MHFPPFMWFWIPSYEFILFFHALEKDPCHPNPCQNNGKCSHDGKGRIECVCPVKFKGERCEGNTSNKH